jgi:hypothetical protein
MPMKTMTVVLLSLSIPAGMCDSASKFLAPVETLAQTCAVPQSTVVDGTCCVNYCASDLESDSCDQCADGDDCQRVDNKECRAGQWPDADNSIDDGKWLPSRSTHYGLTSAGACGFGVAPNCWSGNADGACDRVPEDLSSSQMAGMYAAPQGNYYTQEEDYRSCGECFEIKCVDATCKTNTPIFVQVADSCPCEPNAKWCCGSESHCAELTNSTLSPSNAHCAVSPDGVWEKDSIHLDLSDYAMAALAFGDRGHKKDDLPGVVNTLFRRVSCPVQGNIYLLLQKGVHESDDCYVNQTVTEATCFYNLAFAVMNVAHYGAVSAVDIYGTMLQNGTQTFGWHSMSHDPHYSSARVQEASGLFVGVQDNTYILPAKLRFTVRTGESVETEMFSSLPDCTDDACYYDTGVQFQNSEVDL